MMAETGGAEASASGVPSGDRLRPEWMGGSTEVLAEHFAGWLGETIEQGFVNPAEAPALLQQIVSDANAVIAERDLKRRVEEYRGYEADRLDDSEKESIFSSGAFHGLVAVAEAIQEKLANEEVNPESGAGKRVERRCIAVASYLLMLNFDASWAVVHQPAKDLHEGIDSIIESLYMTGVESTLDGVISTVWSRLQRRLSTIIDQPAISADQERLATLLIVALNHPSLARIVRLLGTHYRSIVESEQDVGNVESAITAMSSNPPLKLTSQGSRATRDLLVAA